jgi:acyl-ACP thioesterase
MSQKRAKKQQQRKKISKGTIDSHKKEGTKLISPFNQIPNTSYMSWMNDRLPCMIWGGGVAVTVIQYQKNNS